MKQLVILIMMLLLTITSFAVETANFNTRSKSNLTVEQIENVLKSTPMEGLGEFILECEEKYNVNAKFILGVACAETRFGKSKLAQKTNAIFSIKFQNNGKYKGYDSKKAAIEGFCDMIANGNIYHRKNRITVSQIAKKYCNNNPIWIKNVLKTINRF